MTRLPTRFSPVPPSALGQLLEQVGPDFGSDYLALLGHLPPQVQKVIQVAGGLGQHLFHRLQMMSQLGFSVSLM